LAVWLFVAAVLSAGTTPKKSAAEYPAHAGTDRAAVGAEYFVRAIPNDTEGVMAGDYLVVEVAVYPTGLRTLLLQPSDFRLRVNGRRTPLLPASPNLVAAAIRHPDWEWRKGLEVGAGPLIIGGPERTRRFPDDPSAPRQRPPAAVNPPRDPRDAAAETVMSLALDGLETAQPRSGLLYFHWKPKANKIRKLELIYEGAAGKVVIPLM
jgi:hypothetical protein